MRSCLKSSPGPQYSSSKYKFFCSVQHTAHERNVYKHAQCIIEAPAFMAVPSTKYCWASLFRLSLLQHCTHTHILLHTLIFTCSCLLGSAAGLARDIVRHCFEGLSYAIRMFKRTGAQSDDRTCQKYPLNELRKECRYAHECMGLNAQSMYNISRNSSLYAYLLLNGQMPCCMDEYHASNKPPSRSACAL